MPQNLSRNPYDINIPSPGVTQGEMLARLQQALIEQQINEADIVASEAKAARTHARLADPIEAMNTQDQIRRFQLRRDVVPQPAPIRGIRAAPAAGPMPANWKGETGAGTPFFTPPSPVPVRGIRRIVEGETAAPVVRGVRPVTTAFGTSTPRTTQTTFGGTPGGLSALRESADQLADPNFEADLLRRRAEASLDPRVLASGAKAAADTGGADVKDAVSGMIAGTIPPQLPGRASKEYVGLLAEAKRQGYDLSTAATDWQAAQKHFATLNGSQQTRIRQAVDTASHSLDVIDDLATRWNGGQFPVLNRASLAAAKHGAYGRQAASIANQLDAQIADVTSELANVYMGGNSPTDHALGLAAKNLSADWDASVLRDMTDLARTNLHIRRNSIANVGAVAASETNRYAPPAGGAPAAGGAPQRHVGETKIAPNGRKLVWDGEGWTDQ